MAQTLYRAYRKINGKAVPINGSNSGSGGGGTELSPEQLAAIELAKTSLQPEDVAGKVESAAIGSTSFTKTGTALAMTQANARIAVLGLAAVNGGNANLPINLAANGVPQGITQANLRTGLGLNTAAYQASTAFATAAQGTLASTAVQPAAIANMVESNGSVDKIVHMTWSAYNALSVKDPKTKYIVPDSPYDAIVDLSDTKFINSPHLWTVDREYNFGDGSFGKRCVGVLPAVAANTGHSLIIDTSLTHLNTRMVTYGGFWQTATDVFAPVPYVNAAATSPTSASIWWGVGGVRLATVVNTARVANMAYDVWIRYTKV